MRPSRAARGPLRDAGVKATPVMAAASIGSRGALGAIQIGEAELAMAVAIALGEDRLRVDPALPGADALAQQLERFSTGRPAKPPAAQAAFAKPERLELVRGLAIACWWGDRQMAARIEQPVPPPVEIDTRPPTFDEVMKHYARR